MTAAGTGNKAARDAWLARVLAALPAGTRLLDAGAGERQYAPLCTHLDYVSQDFGRYDGTGDGKALQTGAWDQSGLDIVCDITAIPEPDASFGAILCVEVLEHLPEPLAALREFARLLAEGGRLILTAPFCSLTHFAPYHFATGFSRYWFEHHLSACGFGDVRIEENGNFFEFLAQEVRRTPDVAKQYCGAGVSPLDRAAVRVLLRALGRLSGKDRGSSELLCFGHHVLATRLGDGRAPR